MPYCLRLFWSAVLLVAVAPAATALMIDLTYVPNGQRFGNSGTQFGFAAPSQQDGGGNLQDIMRAAADVWERALPGDFRIDIEYGWQPLPGNTIGQHRGRGVSFDGGVIRNEASWIVFDNEFNDWYFDAVPEDAREYSLYREADGTYGGVTVNHERRHYLPKTQAARGLDLFTVAVHEIGHAVGWTHSNLSDYQRDSGRDTDDPIVVPGHLPAAGLTVPIHGSHPQVGGASIMAATLASGQRLLPTVLDIVTTATISRFTQIDTGLAALQSDGTGNNTLVDVVLADGSTVRMNLGRLVDLPEPGGLVVAALAMVFVAPRRRG